MILQEIIYMLLNFKTKGHLKMQNNLYYFIKHKILQLAYVLTFSKMQILRIKDFITGKNIYKYNKFFYNINLNYINKKYDLYIKQYIK